jgi:hypothetical protein
MVTNAVLGECVTNTDNKTISQSRNLYLFYSTVFPNIGMYQISRNKITQYGYSNIRDDLAIMVEIREDVLALRKTWKTIIFICISKQWEFVL